MPQSPFRDGLVAFKSPTRRLWTEHFASFMHIESSIPGFYDSDYVHPSCRPFALRSGHPRCLVLLHGLTGTPNDFHDYANAFTQALDVYVPLLPGHGSHVCHLQHLTQRELMIPVVALLQHLTRHYREVHLTGLSYGAILAIAAVLNDPVTSLSLIAPAFVLTPRAERQMVLVRRFRLHRWWPRLTKASVYRRKDFPLSNTHTYPSIALRPAESLHQLATELIPQLGQLDLPVLHCHGDKDDTTPLANNHALLKGTLKRYDFLKIDSGRHVLTLDPNHQALAQQHLAWLQRHFLD